MHRVLALTCLALLASCGPASDVTTESASFELPVSDLIHCELVEQTVTLRDCELAARAEKQTTEGLARLSYSKFMTVGESSAVRLIIDRQSRSQEPMQEAEATVEEPVIEEDTSAPPREAEPSREPAATEREPEVTVTYHPIVGRFMSARLDGDDFELSPSEAVTKEIPRNGQETWGWTLTPLRDGKLTFLVVTIVQFKRTDGTYMALAQKADPYQVTVGVGLVSRIRVFLEGLPGWIGYLTAILTALTVFFAAWFGLRRLLKHRGDALADDAPPSDGKG